MQQSVKMFPQLRHWSSCPNQNFHSLETVVYMEDCRLTLLLYVDRLKFKLRISFTNTFYLFYQYSQYIALGQHIPFVEGCIFFQSVSNFWLKKSIMGIKFLLIYKIALLLLLFSCLVSILVLFILQSIKNISVQSKKKLLSEIMLERFHLGI